MITIFSKVKTPDGIGQVVKLEAEFNGLRILEETATALVYFGMDSNVKINGTRWISYTYKLSELILA